MATHFKVNTGEVPSQPALAKHDCSVLDLAFAMDCTGSMGNYIETARTNIRSIVEEIVASEKSDVHLALVEYRDHPPQDSSFVTRSHDFTSSVGTMKSWLDDCSAQGGGDAPEAVADALHDILKLSWRENATKICVLISDAPPHGLSPAGDGFPNGCPDDLDPMDTVRQLAEKGITLYSVGCEPSINPYKEFFTAIAYLTGGQYIPLRGAKALTQVIIGGAREEISLERWMAEVDEEVQRDISAGNIINDDEMARRIQSKMAYKGLMGKKLQRNAIDLESASPCSKHLAGLPSMTAVRENFKPGHTASAPGFSFSSRSGGVKGDSAEFFGAPSRAVFGGAPSSAEFFGAPSHAEFFGTPSPAVFGGAPSAPSPTMPPPPPREGFGEMAPPSEASNPDVWKTVESNISYEQASRMVQKSKARNKYSS